MVELGIRLKLMADQEKNGSKKFTIKDRARLARVSPSAVSIVLNGKEGVGAETRPRVLKGPSNVSAMPERFEGAVLAMRDYGLAMEDRLSAVGDPTREFGRRATMNMDIVLRNIKNPVRTW